MVITFPCGQCGQRYQVEMKLAGKRIRCKQCQAVLDIPVPRQTAVVLPPAEAKPAARAAQSAARPRPPLKAFDEAPQPATSRKPLQAFGDPPRPSARPAAPAFEVIPDAPVSRAPVKKQDEAPAGLDLYGLDDEEPASSKSLDAEEVFLPRTPAPVRAKPSSPKSKGRRRDSSSGDIPIAVKIAMGLGLGIVVVCDIIAVGLMEGNGRILMLLLGSLVGYLLYFSGLIYALITAFMESVVNGLLMFVPVYGLYYMITRWSEMRKPATLIFGGLGLVIMNGILFASTVTLPKPNVQAFPQGGQAQPNFGGPPPGFRSVGLSPIGGAGDWSVKPDPAPAVKADPAAAKDKAAASKDKTKDKDLSIPIPPSFWGGEVLFPTSVSPYVAVGRNGDANDVRMVIDTTTGRRSGLLRGKLPGDRPWALSPDGAYLAGKLQGKNGVGLWSAKNGKFLGGIEVQSPSLDFIDFGAPNQILSANLGDKVIQVWDMKTGKRLREIKLPGSVRKEAIAFSPGRKYLAMAVEGDGGGLRVYSLADGELAGVATIPKNGIFNLNCKGLAFSPDGKELAGLFESFGMRVMVWNVEDGELAAEHKLDDKSGVAEVQGYEGQALEWLADQSGWLLFGQSVVDHKTGQKVFTIPTEDVEDSQKVARKLLAGDKILLAVGPKQNRALRAFPMPKDRIAKGVTLARSGGSVADADLPPLKSADWSKGEQIRPAAGKLAWTVTLDPAPAAKGTLADRPITLKTPINEVHRILFSSPKAAQAVVSSVQGGFNSFNPSQNDGKPRRLDGYDLATRRHAGRLEIPAVCELTAFSPDASRVLLIDSKDRNRLDAMSTVDGKHVVGWRPYEKQVAEQKAIAWAGFTDADKVLTLSKGGKLVLWSLPDCKAVYFANDAGQGAPVLSPGGKWLAIFRDGTFTFHDAATGQAKGEADLPTSPGGKAELTGAAFSADGKRLAAILNRLQLVVWDVKTGNIEVQFRSPAMAERVAWCGTTHLLLDGRALVDLARKQLVWNYQGGTSATGSPDGRYWYASGRFNDPATLNAIELPDKSALDTLAAADDPSTNAVIRKGVKISLEFNMGAPPNDNGTFRRKAVESLTGYLRNIGVTVADGQPVRLVVKVEERDTGETMQLLKMFSNFKDGKATRTITLRDLICSATLNDSQGPIELGLGNRLAMRSFFGILHLPPGEDDPERYLRQRQWEGVQNWLGSIGLPYYVARQGASTVVLPGTSSLDGTPIAAPTSFESRNAPGPPPARTNINNNRGRMPAAGIRGRRRP